MTTFIKAKLKKSNNQKIIDKYGVAANKTEQDKYNRIGQI